MKTVLALLLTSVMLLLAVGCSSAPAAVGEEVADAPAAPAEAESEAESGEAVDKLVIWTNLTAEAQAVILDKQFTEVAQELGIDVEMVTVSFGDMYTKLATAVATRAATTKG